MKNSIIKHSLLRIALLVAVLFGGIAASTRTATAASGIRYNNGYFNHYRGNWYYAKGYGQIQWVYYTSTVRGAGTSDLAGRTGFFYGFNYRTNKSIVRQPRTWTPGVTTF